MDEVISRILAEPLVVNKPWESTLKNAFPRALSGTSTPVDALLWKLRLSRYYRREAHKLLLQEVEMLRAPSTEIEEFKLKLEAYVTGYAHAVHSLFDLTLQLINACLLGNSLSEKAVGWHAIQKAMKAKGLSNSTAILEAEKLKSLKEWQYIDEFVNSIKHRRAMPSGRMFVSAQVSGDAPGYLGLYLSPIEVQGRPKDYVEIFIFLEDYGEKTVVGIERVLETLGQNMPIVSCSA